MTFRYSLLVSATVVSLATLSACARTATEPVARATTATPAEHATYVAQSVSSDSAAPAMPLVVVHKDESCGCCALWVKHLQVAGFAVDVRNEVNLNPVKERVGVPIGKGSCHTAEVGGYFVEGHVPAEDIKRLLAQKPDAKGLVVPGMPAGSPGMELPDGTVQAYVVELVNRDGSTAIFAEHGGQ